MNTGCYKLNSEEAYLSKIIWIYSNIVVTHEDYNIFYWTFYMKFYLTFYIHYEDWARKKQLDADVENADAIDIEGVNGREHEAGSWGNP